MTAALTLRSPNAGSLADYQLSGGSEWSWLKVEATVERDAGQGFYGYDLNGDHGIFGKWRLAYDSHFDRAQAIERQSLVVGRPVYGAVACGAGVTARAYSQPKGAVDLSLPLPGGRLSYTTDFKRAHVILAETCLDFPLGQAVDLFFLGRLFHDRRTSYQARAGLKVHLERREAAG